MYLLAAADRDLIAMALNEMIDDLLQHPRAACSYDTPANLGTVFPTASIHRALFSVQRGTGESGAGQEPGFTSLFGSRLIVTG
ncbi:hypothetical protein C4K88_00195 [Arthrobacter pityocampae]|uniref:Uncharacterized protein n=1 Tax=Arthrobacter pityocampae TaxID=547334 RepID=A0A2S5J0M7_9MICC|nr:hypothetical protein C4K88_00195 [Arthrobacter pityocampae]